MENRFFDTNELYFYQMPVLGRFVQIDNIINHFNLNLSCQLDEIRDFGVQIMEIDIIHEKGESVKLHYIHEKYAIGFIMSLYLETKNKQFIEIHEKIYDNLNHIPS